MGIRSTLSSLVSAPLAPLLEARVRELVEATLDARDLAEPAMVRELSTQIERTRRAVDELRGEVASCREVVGALGENEESSDDLALRVAGLTAQDEELTAQLTTLQDRLSTLGDRVVELRTSVAAVASTTGARAAVEAPAPTAPVAPSAARSPSTPAHAEPLPPEPGADEEGDRGCKVPGCANAHRARGFCGRHYQMWKRSKLPGFVGPDGMVAFEGTDRRWSVDKALAGEPAESTARGVKVGGKRVSAESLA